MKQYKYRRLYSITLLCAALLAGCTKDTATNQETPNDGKTVEATFTLASDFVEEIEVRSVSGVDETKIKDLWVVQFTTAGVKLQANYISDASKITISGSDYKVTVPLTRQESKIYFIANTHKADAYTSVTTIADVEAVAMQIASEANLATSDGIPMSGVWSGTPDLLGITGRVSLSRAVAKVNFKLRAALPIREMFKLESVTVKQVPNTLNYHRDGSKLETYPYPGTLTTVHYTTTSYNKVNLSTTPQSLWWYLPENARGTSTATLETEKGIKFPTTPTDQAAYCTYIEVTGQYILSTGMGYATTYRIYLGTNNTNDYNLKRNTTYNVNTTIRGIDIADTRINIKEIFCDYTDNGKGWFLLAPDEAKNPDPKTADLTIMNWYQAVGVYEATKNPSTLGPVWNSECQMPTLNQLMLMWIYKDGMANHNLKEEYVYWGVSTYPGVEGDAWCTSFATGNTYGGGKGSTNVRVRCLKEGTDKKYPYVSGGNIIVSRDAVGGVNSGAIRSNATIIATHNETEPLNRVPAKLEVASADATNPSTSLLAMNWYIASGTKNDDHNLNGLNACPTGWRLPTQRELMLIRVLYNEGMLSITNFKSGATYWTLTDYKANSNYVWYLNVVQGNTGGGNKNSETYARCVRDVSL